MLCWASGAAFESWVLSVGAAGGLRSKAIVEPVASKPLAPALLLFEFQYWF